MTRGAAGQRGAALVAAIFVLVVLAVLIGALCFVALQEYRVGRNGAGARRAADAAEAGLDAVLAGWRSAGFSQLDTGAAAPFAGTLPSGTGAWSGYVLRLNPRLFLVHATGHDAAGSARRTEVLVVRIAPLTVAAAAALTSHGAVRIGPTGLVRGDGAAADEGPCASTPDTVAGVLASSLGQVALEGCALGLCVRGNPAVGEDASLGGASVPVAGESGWARLTSAADVELAAGATLAGPGDSAFRVLHAAGDLEIVGGSRRGVLLTDGSLVLSAGTVFRWLVVVRGQLRFGEGGGSVFGSALVGSADVGVSGGLGIKLVAHSWCSVHQALAAASAATPLPERAWAEVY